MVFFLEDPRKNVIRLLEKIEFGQLAGFYINKTKSKLLLKNITKKEKMKF